MIKTLILFLMLLCAGTAFSQGVVLDSTNTKATFTLNGVAGQDLLSYNPLGLTAGGEVGMKVIVLGNATTPNIQLGTGPVTATTTRVTLATDGPGVANLVTIANNTTGASKAAGAPNFATGQLTTSTTSTQLVALRATRRSIAIRNIDAAINIYYGPGTVTSSNGALLKPGESQPVDTSAAINVISASGTPIVNYIETYD